MGQGSGSENGLFKVWLVPLGLVGIVFLVSYVFFLGWDKLTQETSYSFWSLLTDHDAAAGELLGSVPEVVAAILGIAITVVAIIVELASNRYTSRVTDLFIRDRVNFAVMSLFVVGTLQSLWLVATMRDGFVPTVSLRWTMALMTLSLLILLPYFSYVFTFLQPTNIIQRIREQMKSSLAKVSTSASEEELIELKLEQIEAVEQIADIALNSILQRDRGLAMASTFTLRGIIFDYFEHKPEMQDIWFKISEEQKNNPDYVTLSDQGLDALVVSRTWLEYKVFKQLNLVFAQSLNNLRDLNNLIAMCFRDIGIEANKRGDEGARELVVNFFNTAMRATLNTKDVRTAYNVLHQYRHFCSELIREGCTEQVEKIFNYLKYYGLLFDSMGIGFILETVAYDLYRLTCEASDAKLSNEKKLLSVFLEVDRPPDPGSSDMHLRGVRKAQAMLAAFYLFRNKREAAERIARDMMEEPSERLISIKREILSAAPNFWEITDRGMNFDYLEEELRPSLAEYFSDVLPSVRTRESTIVEVFDDPEAATISSMLVDDVVAVSEAEPSETNSVAVELVEEGEDPLESASKGASAGVSEESGSGTKAS